MSEKNLKEIIYADSLIEIAEQDLYREENLIKI